MDNRNPLIVNVDDTEAPRYAKTRSLQHAGFRVVEAATGYEALRKTEELQPALVVLDVNLPDISGIEVCGVIKRRWPGIPVLQVSATHITSADRARGLEGGADSYLFEPLEPEELVAATRALLRLRAAEADLRRLNETLEQRVRERTAELETANIKLKEEIEQRKQAEAALVQAQKMEAIGLLTGGIAHDFNNLLTVVIGNVDRLRTRVTEPKLAKLAEYALMAAKRGAKLTAQLLAFSRTQKLAIEPVDVNALMDSMSDLLTQSLGLAARLEISLPDDLPHVCADTNQLELAILNLSINARDAIVRGSGEIKISCAPVRLDKAERDLPAGDYVCITVRDNGSGMPAEVLARASEPFFTTKPAGKGTGLGLSQVYGLVRDAGGAVRIVSETGAGTAVSMYLRVADERAKPVKVEQAEAAHRNTETILVVDDDNDVRMLIGDYLQEIGYRTFAAQGGDDAWKLLDNIEPDLLIADFAMPEYNGAELARAVRTRYPRLPILFVSGYADLEALEDAVGNAPLLHKPFRPAELAAAIRLLLDRHTVANRAVR